MKKAIVLALALVSFQSFADNRYPGGNGPGGRIDFPQCLKELDRVTRHNGDLQNQLNSCLSNNRRPDINNGREVEELRRENRRLNETIDRLTSDNRNLSDSNARLSYDNNALNDSNNRLFRENADLRRQLDDLQGGNRNLGFFSYAGCKDFSGNVSLTLIQAAEGRFQLEAETNAVQAVTKNYSCSYGVKVAATEEILNRDAKFYCVAGCKDFSGNVNNTLVKSGMGRNITEAQFNAMKEVAKNFSCSYGIKVQACQ